MTGRIKLFLCLAAILAALAAGFGLRGCLFRGPRQAAEQEREKLQTELNRVQQRLAFTETDLNSKRKEIVTLREKSSGRKLSPPPPDCQQCFARAGIEVEVRDKERGWWIFRDRDVLDREPGELTLTPKFWEDVTTEGHRFETGGTSPAKIGAKPVSRWKTEKEIRAGISLTGYEVGFDFSPLVLSGRKWQARLSLSSRLEFDRLDASLRGNLSAGLAFRW